MNELLKAVRPTAFIKSEKLSRQLGVDLTIASETFQHTGSFKFRAAYNVALHVSEDHLITASSGNFGQALAYACRLLGKRCHVVMPQTSAEVKIEAVGNYGATLDLIDVKKIGREERVSQLMDQFPDAYQASAYDDPLVIEGNSSLGIEIAEYAGNFDSVLVPVGGAGLISGIARGLSKDSAGVRVIGAEPLLANDAARSLRAGMIIKNEHEPMTIADGARTVSVGMHNWEIVRNHVSDIIEVSEAKIQTAMQLYFVAANLKVEPTGALALGAILETPEAFKGRKVCLIVSGGNVDPALFCRLLANGL